MHYLISKKNIFQDGAKMAAETIQFNRISVLLLDMNANKVFSNMNC